MYMYGTWITIFSTFKQTTFSSFRATDPESDDALATDPESDDALATDPESDGASAT